MAKIDKTIDRMLSLPKDFSWAELQKVLNHFGYEELQHGKTGGSRRKFVDEQNHVISLHKPHPQNILKNYQLKQVIEQLKEKGVLK
jgi:hypothetical protein